MSAEHTPTPWEQDGTTVRRQYDNNYIVANCDEQRGILPMNIANAAFIVRACNAHAELLALARQYASECAECDGEGTFDAELGFEEVCEACVDIRKIIAKAVGK